MAKSRFTFDVDQWIGGTSLLTPAQAGIYIRLLCCQWSRGSLTDEQAMAAAGLGANPADVRYVLSEKFALDNGRWINRRLEQERKQTAKQTSTAVIVSSPVVLTFPTNGEAKQWQLTEQQVNEWLELYPTLDVMAECRKALAWVQSNNRKTARGMRKFLTSWLSRACDRSGRPQTSQQIETFRERDERRNQEMVRKLALEEMGLAAADAERLAKIPEYLARVEAAKILGARKQIVIDKEEIPW